MIDTPLRRRARRVVVAAVLVVQAGFIVRGIHADHKEFAYRMFAEASDWRADISLVTPDGDREPIDDEAWSALVRGRGLDHPSGRHHADAGLPNQLAFLRSALRWYAEHDGDDGVVEARVTSWRNQRGPEVVVYRSDE